MSNRQEVPNKLLKDVSEIITHLKHIMRTYYVLGTVPSTEDTLVNFPEFKEEAETKLDLFHSLALD